MLILGEVTGKSGLGGDRLEKSVPYDRKKMVSKLHPLPSTTSAGFVTVIKIFPCLV